MVNLYLIHRQGGSAMKIDNAAINISGKYTRTEEKEKKETLKVWVDPPERNDSATFSDYAKNMSARTEQSGSTQQEEMDIDPKLRMLVTLLERMFGIKVKVTSLKLNQSNAPVIQTQPQSTEVQPPAPQKEGWGLDYHLQETTTTVQSQQFQASGTIKTAEGKNIDFNLAVLMDSSTTVTNDLRILDGDARIDPLIISFNGGVAELTGERFKFDLNSDGKMENVPIVKDGSGLLFLDKNGNGKVDNGKELFGPATGNGMQELSQYDDDKNGWIDENDQVFSKLAIWTKDANQQDQLKSLLDYNIGAIYTGSIQTAFQHNADTGELLGETTQLGAFIREDGSAGLVQQVDFMA
jgi:hypothetical protein